jgi:hypothetical protein
MLPSVLVLGAEWIPEDFHDLKHGPIQVTTISKEGE